MLREERSGLENKLAKLVERVLDANSPTLLNVYENSVQELEKRSLFWTKNSKKCAKRQRALKKHLEPPNRPAHKGLRAIWG